jgi:hypothetical protein
MSDIHTRVYDLKDFESRKFLPPGKYRGVICGHLVGTTQKGTDTIRLLVRPEDPLSGQDISGVEMNVELKSETFFDTDNARGRFFDAIRKIDPAALRPGNLPSIAENVMLAQVNFDFVQKKSRTSDATYWECVNITAA